MKYLTRLYVRMSEARGQTFTEYALIMGLVVVGAISAYATMGTDIQTVINSVASSLTSAL